MSKTHTLKCAAYNLGLLLRKVWGYCKPRNAEAAAALFFAISVLLATGTARVHPILRASFGWWLNTQGVLRVTFTAIATTGLILSSRKNRHFLTGC